MASLYVDRGTVNRFKSNHKYINGLAGSAKVHAGLDAVAKCTYSSETGLTSICFYSFPRGSVAVVFTTPENPSLLQRLQQHLRDTITRTPSLLAAAETADLNILLYRCSQEELDASGGKRGSYDIPGYGPMVYCGLVGPCVVFDKVRQLMPRDQLQHPICANLIAGTWLLQYLADRLEEPTLLPLQQQLQQTMKLLEQLKGYDWIRPYICDRLVSGMYAQVGTMVISRLPSAVTPSPTAIGLMDPLLVHLLMATLQFYGRVPSSPLVWGTQGPSLCAGLPFFTTGFMRNWGRDTFIALKGSLIAPG